MILGSAILGTLRAILGALESEQVFPNLITMSGDALAATTFTNEALTVADLHDDALEGSA